MKKAMKLKQENVKRSKILSKLFSSLFMSVGAVIIVIAFVPKSPVATINQLQVFKDTVTYSVSVQDEDSAILGESLTIILENQFTYQSTPLPLGTTVGIFQSLSPDTIYTIKVMANIGFGMELLTKETFVTEERVGGMIFQNTLLSSEDDYQLDYRVSTYISDPYDEITNTYVKISYIYLDEFYTQTVDKPDQMVLEGLDQFTVQGLYNENIQVTYLLFGTINNEEVVLDTYKFFTPVRLYASFYPVQILPDKINLGIYGRSIEEYQTEFSLKLYENGSLLKTIPYTMPQYAEEQMNESSSGLWIDGLVNNHLYTMELWVRYVDPNTLSVIDTLLEEFDFQTPHFSDYSARISDHDDYIEVFITGEDPFGVYQNAGYVIYDEEDGYHYYHFMSFTSLVTENGVTTATFVIDKDPTKNQTFSVYVFNEEQYEINLYLYEYEPL